MTTRSHHRAAFTGHAVADALFLVVVGVVTGLVTGLALVHLFGLLGLHVDTGTGDLLRRAFLP